MSQLSKKWLPFCSYFFQWVFPHIKAEFELHWLEPFTKAALSRQSTQVFFIHISLLLLSLLIFLKGLWIHLKLNLHVGKCFIWYTVLNIFNIFYFCWSYTRDVFLQFNPIYPILLQYAYPQGCRKKFSSSFPVPRATLNSCF